MARARPWRFTHNNYDGTYVEDNVECEYIIYGKEIAPTTGTPHLQGFIYFKSLKSQKQLRALLPDCDVRISDFPEQCIAYCKKDGDFTERGECPTFDKRAACGAGEKRRWDLIRIAAEEGRDEDLPDDIRYKNLQLNKRHRIEYLRSRPLADTETQMLWYWGEAGTGKSRKAREDYPDAYLKGCNKWCDGAESADVWIIEDFDRKHDVLCHHLKLWGDRYPFSAEIKGGIIKLRPKLIIVTSNYHPHSIWSDPSDYEPILRRFKCIEFKKLACMLN